MIRPCPEKITCPGTDDPVTNYSAEGPEDPPQWYSLYFPENWDKMGCLSLCTSSISQADADACALAQEASCHPTAPTPPNMTGEDPPVFCSTPQTCVVGCASSESEFTSIAPAGLFCDTTQEAADARANAYACAVASDCPFVLGALPCCACYAEPYARSIPYSGIAPVAWFVTSGSLPTGLTLSDTGFLSGTPLLSGDFTFTIRAYLADGNFATRQYTITVLQILTTTLPNYSVGTPYSYQLQAIGGLGGYVWSLLSGTLPPGLHLSATGLISGTPTTAGTYGFDVRITYRGVSCFWPLILESGCPVPAAYTYSTPATIAKSFAMVNTFYLPANAVMPSRRVLVPAAAGTNCLDEVNFALAVPAVSRSFSIGATAQRSQAAIYDPHTSQIVAHVIVGSGPFTYVIAFFNATTGAFVSSVATTLTTANISRFTLISDQPGKILFSEQGIAKVLIIDANTRTVAELTAGAITTDREAQYCCSTQEFFRARTGAAGGIVMLNSVTGVQRAVHNAVALKTIRVRYCDSSGKLLISNITDKKFQIMNPVTGVIELEVAYAANRDTYQDIGYDFKLDTLVAAGYNTDFLLNPVLTFLNPATLATVHEVNTDGNWVHVSTTNNIAFGSDTGHVYVTDEPLTQWVFEAAVTHP